MGELATAVRRRLRGPGGASAAPPPTPSAAGLADDFPAVRPHDVDGARLFAGREDMMRALVEPGGVVAEVGVALGDFSEFILRELRPAAFVAIDLFELHLQPEARFRGRAMGAVFGDLTHAEYYRRRFEGAGARLAVEQGDSWEGLARQPDAHFDVIYVDAAHDLESVRRDAAAAVEKLKPDGVLVFNDYIMYDHLHGEPYGIVQTVNDLVVNHGWRVAGFALQRHMFCDIAIRRAAA